MPFDVELLHILACPACRSALEDAGELRGLLCPNCSLVYPVREEIPVMLTEEAVSLAEWRAGNRAVERYNA